MTAAAPASSSGATTPRSASRVSSTIYGPASQGSHPADLTVLNGRLLFRAYTRDQLGCQLWQSDGTAAGTSSAHLLHGAHIHPRHRAREYASRVRRSSCPRASFGRATGPSQAPLAWAPSASGSAARFAARAARCSSRPGSTGSPVGRRAVGHGRNTGRHFVAARLEPGRRARSRASSSTSTGSRSSAAATESSTGCGAATARRQVRRWSAAADHELAAVPPPTRLAAGQNLFYISNEGRSRHGAFRLQQRPAARLQRRRHRPTSAAAVTIAVLANDRDPDGALDAVVGARLRRRPRTARRGASVGCHHLHVERGFHGDRHVFLYRRRHATCGFAPGHGASRRRGAAAGAAARCAAAATRRLRPAHTCARSVAASAREQRRWRRWRRLGMGRRSRCCSPRYGAPLSSDALSCHGSLRRAARGDGLEVPALHERHLRRRRDAGASRRALARRSAPPLSPRARRPRPSCARRASRGRACSRGRRPACGRPGVLAPSSLSRPRTPPRCSRRAAPSRARRGTTLRPWRRSAAPRSR